MHSACQTIFLLFSCFSCVFAKNTFFLDIKNGEANLGEDFDVVLSQNRIAPDSIKDFPESGTEFTLVGYFKFLSPSEIFSISIGSESLFAVYVTQNLTEFNVSIPDKISFKAEFNNWYFMVLSYTENESCDLKLYNPEKNLTMVEPSFGGPFFCEKKTFDFKTLEARFNTTETNFKNLKFFFIDIGPELDNQYFFNQSLVASFSTISHMYDFTNGNSNHPFWVEYPTAFALVVDQTKNKADEDQNTTYLWKEIQGKLKNDKDAVISVWINLDSSSFEESNNETQYIEILKLLDKNGKDMLILEAECYISRIDGARICDTQILKGIEHIDQKDDIFFDKWTLIKLTLSPVFGKNEKYVLGRLSTSQSNFTIVRDFQTKSMFNEFQIEDIASVQLGGTNLKGAFKEIQVFDGAYFNLEGEVSTNCLIENSASYFTLENHQDDNKGDELPQYHFQSSMHCFLCNQKFMAQGRIYIPYLWNGQTCSLECDEMNNHLDYSTRYCRSCLDGKCFLQAKENYTQYHYDCGNGRVEPYFNESCDLGFGIKRGNAAEYLGCELCQQSKNYTCDIDLFGISSCTHCSAENCNSLIEGTSHYKTPETLAHIKQCKESCGYLFWDDLTDEGIYQFLDPSKIPSNRNLDLCDGVNFFSSETPDISFFPDYNLQECKLCTLDAVNSIYGSQSNDKKTICKDKCHFKWKSDRHYCSHNFQAKSLYIDEAKFLTAFLLVILIIEYLFLLTIEKGGAFWLVWEFIVQANMLLYVTYDASNNITEYLIFLNFVTLQNLMLKFNPITYVQSLFSVEGSSTQASNLYEFALSKIQSPSRAGQVGRIAYFFGDAGIVLCLFVFLIVLGVIMFFVGRFVRRFRKTKRFYSFLWWFSNIFTFSIYFRFISELYVYLTFWSFLQINSITIPEILLDLQQTIFQDDASFKKLFDLKNFMWIIVSYSSAIGTIVLITGIFPALVFIINKEVNREKQRDVNMFSALFSGYTSRNWFGKNFSFFRLVRSFTIAFGVGIITDNPMIQCAFLLGIQILFVGLVGTNNVMVNQRLDTMLLILISLTIIIYAMTTVEAICSYVGYSLIAEYLDVLSELQIALIIFGLGVAVVFIGLDLWNSKEDIKEAFKLPEEAFWGNVLDEEEDSDTKGSKQGRKIKDLLAVRRVGFLEMAKMK